MKFAYALAALTALSACGDPGPDGWVRTNTVARAEPLLAAGPDRSITVLRARGIGVTSYRLRSCHGGTRVCGNRTGRLTQTETHDVVTGAYHGVTFYLSPAGDGYVMRHGHKEPIVWNYLRPKPKSDQ